MPIELAEVEGEGNIRIRGWRDGVPVIEVVREGGTHVSHFYTCPDAGRWRK
jgi:hypothetical protein